MTLRIIGGYVIELYCLTIDDTVTFLSVNILRDDLTKTEELALVTVFLSVRVGKESLHEWSVVVDAIINGHGRHHPLTTGKPIGWRAVLIVECEGSSEGVSDTLEHVCPADGRASNLQLAFLIRFQYVEIAVTIYIL